MKVWVSQPQRQIQYPSVTTVKLLGTQSVMLYNAAEAITQWWSPDLHQGLCQTTCTRPDRTFQMNLIGSFLSMLHHSSKFGAKRFSSFGIILQTNNQINQQTDRVDYTTPLGGGNKWKLNPVCFSTCLHLYIFPCVSLAPANFVIITCSILSSLGLKDKGFILEKKKKKFTLF